jgi:hypothetical protein
MIRTAVLCGVLAVVACRGVTNPLFTRDKVVAQLEEAMMSVGETMRAPVMAPGRPVGTSSPNRCGRLGILEYTPHLMCNVTMRTCPVGVLCRYSSTIFRVSRLQLCNAALGGVPGLFSTACHCFMHVFVCPSNGSVWMWGLPDCCGVQAHPRLRTVPLC